MTSEETRAEQLLLAWRVVRAVERRAMFHEGVGVLRSWDRCTAVDQPEEAEAAWGVAVVEARARGRGDPDWYG